MAGDVEADILARLIDGATLTPAAAEGLPQLGYAEADHARMAELAARSNRGTLTAAERRELEAYVFVGDLLSTLKSKARLLLH